MTHNPLDLFFIFLRLGLTSFGGPVAHLSYFREEFVLRRGWLSEHEYADLVSLCQFLPGPASSQVGIAIGQMKQGYTGAFLAWLGFTLPSTVILVICALGITHYGQFFTSSMITSLKIIAAGVVIQAIWGMARNICVNYLQFIIAAFATIVLIFFSSLFNQLLVLFSAAAMGILFLKDPSTNNHQASQMLKPDTRGRYWLAFFFALLAILPLSGHLFSSNWLSMIDSYYRTGSLVFGGGHVVLPLLHNEVVITNTVSDELFVAGYGIAQAVPGPLFTFAAYLGAASDGWVGGLVALCSIFLPSFLLIFAVLPSWHVWRHHQTIRSALSGINAAVVGLLMAALYDPVLTHAVTDLSDLLFVGFAVFALIVLRCPAWFLVLLGMLSGLSVLLFSLRFSVL